MIHQIKEWVINVLCEVLLIFAPKNNPMQDLAFYYFQCVNDRIEANAQQIEMYIVENEQVGFLELVIRDDGIKYDAGQTVVEHESSAVSYLRQLSQRLSGKFQMLSHAQTGNLIEISLPLQSKERPILGGTSSFLSMLYVSYPKIHFIYSQISRKGEFIFDSEIFNQKIGATDRYDRTFLKNLNQLLEAEITAIKAFD